MESAKYVIVGGGIAGTTAAVTIRQQDPEGRIVIITDESHSLYARKLLPDYILGKSGRDDLFLRQAAYYQSQTIDLWTDSRAVSLDLKEQVITLEDERQLQYQKFLLAGGARQRAWSVPGGQLAGVLSMRTLDQAETIRGCLSSAKHVVVVGGGFITLGFIEALTAAGVAATVVIRDPYYWSGIVDEEAGNLLQSLIDRATSVRMLYQTAVEHIEGDRQVEGVVLSNGKRLPADLVLTNIGVGPDVDWLASSGLRIDGGVEADATLQTSDPAVWAAGDIALFEDKLAGLRHRLGNWDNSLAHGQTAGYNMVADQPKSLEALTAYSVNFFDTNISFIGDFHHHADMVALPRGSARSGHYGRLLLRDHKVVGATLIDRFADRQPVEQLIRSGVALNRQSLLDLTDESLPLRDTVKRLTT
jgi:3-phenylpropionate/trans-cinnamate dioxygenase ferredoxin reductase subunit